MTNVYSLLNLNQEILENFALQGRLIENNVETDRILRNAARKLKSIEDRMQDDGKKPNFDLQSIEKVIAKVERCADGAKEELTVKELRLVSYHLGRLRYSQKYFYFALQLLEVKWRNLYLNGLMFFLMNSWNVCSPSLLNSTIQVVKRYLVKYNGGIRKYQILKKQCDFLEKAGPIRLAKLLIAKKLSLAEAPTILGYKPTALSFPFFSDVIFNYFKSLENVNYSELEDLFKLHSLDRTKKLIYSYLVEKAENSCDGNFQGAVVRSARRVLGDINIATTWSPFTGATEDEVQQLNKAKDLVIAWGARKTVDAFFDVCVQDPRRRDCWLDFVNNIMDYRIVGSASIRTKLQAHTEVAPLLKSCFIETNSKVSVTAALVIFIKDKVFVEFSDIGSLYIYNATNATIKDIKKKRYVDSISDLKQTSLGMAYEQNSSWIYLYDEGRITHIGKWEERFRKWMLDKMQIKPGQKIIYSVPKHDFPDNERRLGIDKIVSDISNTSFNSTTDNNPRQKSSWSESMVTQPSLFPEEDTVNKTNKPSDSQIAPGTRIKTEVIGIGSKWIFDDMCRILINKNGIYIYLKHNKRTYYAAPSPIKNLDGYNIWVSPSNYSTKKFFVKLAWNKKNYKDALTELIGAISYIGDTITYIPNKGNKAVIQIN